MGNGIEETFTHTQEKHPVRVQGLVILLSLHSENVKNTLLYLYYLFRKVWFFGTTHDFSWDYLL